MPFPSFQPNHLPNSELFVGTGDSRFPLHFLPTVSHFLVAVHQASFSRFTMVLLLSFPLMQTLVGCQIHSLVSCLSLLTLNPLLMDCFAAKVVKADKAYYICNPDTQQWKELPKSNANHGSDPAIVLLFEPSLLNFVAEYKIICAFPSTDFEAATEFDIYSSREDSWEVAGEICFGARKVMPETGVHVNGVVYWMTTGSILAFDLTKERSQLLQSYDICPSYVRGFLGAFSGKLCMVYGIGNPIKVNILFNPHLNTMQMESNSRMWSQKETVVLDSKIVGDVAINYSVLHVDSDIMVAHCRGRMYSYDFKSRATKLLSSRTELLRSQAGNHYRCFPYVNSLVSL